MINGKNGLSKNGLEAMRLAGELDWAVFCCWGVTHGRCDCGDGDCKSAGKHPLGKLVPQGCRDATSDGQLITEWWSRYPTANVGVATGDASGIWVLDLDRKADGDGLRQFAELDPLEFGYDGIEDTPKQKTGNNGRQVFFRQPNGIDIRNQQKVSGFNIDVRGQGGYVIVDPSANAGGDYVWEISPFDVAVTPAADWIVALATGQRPVDGSPSGNSLVFRCDGDLATHPGVGEGERNQMLCRLVGQHLAAHGVDNDLFQLAFAWNDRCQPPLDRKQVEKTVVSLAEKHVREKPKPAERDGTPNVYSLSTVESAQVEWLWQDRLPKKLCIVSGNAGDGKTFMMIDIAARVTRGGDFPDGAACKTAKVLFATVEDGIADTIRPRAEAAGADLDNFLIFDGIRRADGETDLLLLDRHIPILRGLLIDTPDIGLIVIDPIGAFYGKIDSHKDAEVRQVLAPLSRLADEQGVCIVGIAHMSKNTQQKAIHRTLGSVGIVAAARSAWGVIRDREDRSRRLFLPIKNNLADPTGLAFTITDGKVVWEPDPVEIGIDDVDEMPSQDTAFDEAKRWLSGKFAELPMLSSKLIKQATADGVSKRTLDRARQALSLEAKQVEGKGWTVFPPSQVIIGEDNVTDETFRF